MFDLNPLSVLKQRKLKTIPPHFSKIRITESEIFEGIEEWVNVKLKGRYCIAKQPAVNKDNHLQSSYFIGFEDQKELTYFMLACPLLRRN